MREEKTKRMCVINLGFNDCFGFVQLYYFINRKLWYLLICVFYDKMSYCIVRRLEWRLQGPNVVFSEMGGVCYCNTSAPKSLGLSYSARSFLLTRYLMGVLPKVGDSDTQVAYQQHPLKLTASKVTLEITQDGNDLLYFYPYPVGQNVSCGQFNTR